MSLDLDAARARIAGRLNWSPAKPVCGQVNLGGAAVGELWDNWSDPKNRPNGCWPTGGALRLDGFTYTGFGGDQQATVTQRLDWIRSQYQPRAGNGPTNFAAQPYEQLAAVYRQAGQDIQARKVAIARRADLRHYGNINQYRKISNWLLDKTIKYGYQTWRAAVGLVIVFVAFLALSWWAQHNDVMVPVGKNVSVSAGKTSKTTEQPPSANQCTSSYPCFYPFGYAIDTVIPIIKVGQAQYWRPDRNAHGAWHL